MLFSLGVGIGVQALADIPRGGPGLAWDGIPNPRGGYSCWRRQLSEAEMVLSSVDVRFQHQVRYGA